MDDLKTNNDSLVEEYINSLTIIEKIAYNIAVQQLESSFNIEKSIGYIEFLKEKEKEKEKDNVLNK